MTGVSGGMLSGKKIRKLRSSSCWKCIKIVNPSITTLFLYHFKYLRSHQADLLALGGGGVRAHPAHPPCLRACIVALGFAGHRRKEMLGLFAQKFDWFQTIRNKCQQVPTLLWFHANRRNMVGPTMLRVVCQQQRCVPLLCTDLYTL